MASKHRDSEQEIDHWNERCRIAVIDWDECKQRNQDTLVVEEYHGHLAKFKTDNVKQDTNAEHQVHSNIKLFVDKTLENVCIAFVRTALILCRLLTTTLFIVKSQLPVCLSTHQKDQSYHHANDVKAPSSIHEKLGNAFFQLLWITDSLFPTLYFFLSLYSYLLNSTIWIITIDFWTNGKYLFE